MPTEAKTQSTSPDVVDVQTWVAGDGPKQVAVAGLLASNRELHEAELTRDEWEAHLADYLDSPRP